ncbi:MAG: EscU/YscU/HrcU family type III secretion system export apparatus switch protein [Deltaproteobacteria bacterium]|nr:EscU/YscU/HrcU family type III secretion system export apparatus switch protein [Deltaproteobacteria bacterium]
MEKTPKVKKAAALLYDKEKDAAPRIIASGRGQVAERIIETGRDAGVAVMEDAELGEVLEALPLGAQIPPELYQAVAEVLAFVYQAGQKYRHSKNST